MLCPKCNKNTLCEEEKIADRMKSVACSSCGFRSTLLEYHAWKNIQEKELVKKKIMFSTGRFLEEDEPLNLGISLEGLQKTWENIRIPMLIILSVLMMVFVISVLK